MTSAKNVFKILNVTLKKSHNKRWYPQKVSFSPIETLEQVVILDALSGEFKGSMQHFNLFGKMECNS